MATILSRSKWTSTSARGNGFNWSRMRGIVVHYPAAGRDIGVISQSEEASKLRGWRNYHVSGRGWVDIGYNYGIGQSGRIYSLRGNRVGAHTGGHNSSTVGVLFIVGDNEPLTAAAKKSFKSLRAYLRNKGAGSGVWGHQQMSGASTRCPGPYIMASVRDGSLAAGTGGGAAKPGSGGGGKYESPTANHKVGSRVMGLYDGGDDVNWLQRRMYKLGYKITPKRDGSFDSLFGPELKTAVRKLQEKVGITVDGLAGKDTIAAAKAEKPVRNLPKKPKHAKPKPQPFPLPKGHWYGPESSNKKNHSGYWSKDRPAIRAIQEKVDTGVDGRYGPKTYAAVSAFQRRAKIRVDGAVGAVTWSKLF